MATDRRSATERLPELVGAGDAAEILGVSRSRFSGALKDRLPEPRLTSSGPIWARSDVEELAKVDRPGGRPRSPRVLTPGS